MYRLDVTWLVGLLGLGVVAGCGGSETEQTENEVSAACEVDADCEDEVACTTGECVEGTCEFMPDDTQCDGDTCRQGICNPAEGCRKVPYVEGTPCAEGVCSEGACVECLEDGDCGTEGPACRVASCVDQSCEYADDDGACEEDGVGCTAAMCTADEGCRQVPRDEACEDDNACTIGTCDADRGCEFEPVGFGGPCEGGACVDGECRSCDEVVTLWDNGPLVTHRGTAVDGYDASRMQNDSLDMSTLGFNASGERQLAEQFRVRGEEGWRVETLTVYAYQTGSDRMSTVEEVSYEIWDGRPGGADSSRVAGDVAEDALRAGEFSGIYRTSETNSGTEADERPIMEVEASVGAALGPGEYWVVWRLGGSLDSGPWVPPVTITGQASTGNAYRRQEPGGVWEKVRDGDSGAPQGLPFEVVGHATACGE
jgi:hypothetical protein